MMLKECFGNIQNTHTENTADKNSDFRDPEKSGTAPLSCLKTGNFTFEWPIPTSSKVLDNPSML